VQTLSSPPIIGVGANVKNTNSASGFTYSISKFSASDTAETILQLTVPADYASVFIKASFINSRFGSTIGTSRMGEYYYSIGRNGSGFDVVLTNNIGTKNWYSDSTTAGGSLDPVSATTTIVRDGAESNTSPQVVNITFNPQVTGGSFGRATIKFDIISMGSSLTIS
jgi:hypothetical protein